jgi:hypothetical protein
MKRAQSTITAVIVVATTIAGTPAFAQNRHEQGNGENRNAPAARAEQRATGQAVPRAVPRAETHAYVAPRAVQSQVVRPYYNHAPAVRPYYAHPYYAHPYYAHPYYAYPYYPRPYAFRPHTTLSFGVVLGYPVPYTYAYPYPVPVYGYGAPRGPVVVGPSSTQYGGVSLEFSPPDASVYVDGGYAGVVHDFDGTRNTLTLTAGRHHIEISAPGFEPVTLDVDTYAGQIVPYQGQLRPY